MSLLHHPRGGLL
jgi:hypothetical protein